MRGALDAAWADPSAAHLGSFDWSLEWERELMSPTPVLWNGMPDIKRLCTSSHSTAPVHTNGRKAQVLRVSRLDLLR